VIGRHKGRNKMKIKKKSLALQTALISGVIDIASMTDISEFCRGIKEDISARVTVIDTEGKVLGDSDKDASIMERYELINNMDRKRTIK